MHPVIYYPYHSCSFVHALFDLTIPAYCCNLAFYTCPIRDDCIKIEGYPHLAPDSTYSKYFAQGWGQPARSEKGILPSLPCLPSQTPQRPHPKHTKETRQVLCMHTTYFDPNMVADYLTCGLFAKHAACSFRSQGPNCFANSIIGDPRESLAVSRQYARACMHHPLALPWSNQARAWIRIRRLATHLLAANPALSAGSPNPLRQNHCEQCNLTCTPSFLASLAWWSLNLVWNMTTVIDDIFYYPLKRKDGRSDKGCWFSVDKSPATWFLAMGAL